MSQEVVFSKAFSTGPGMEYNRVAYELREANRGRTFVIYEIPPTEGYSWEHLKENVYPRLASFIRSKGLDPVSGKNLVITLFSAESYYLIDGPDFMALYREMEKINSEEFACLVEGWSS